MKLSVVIVNYNVQHFLEQCLHSVRKAALRVETEIFVVDNNSVDGSVQMVREKFPEAILIANTENLGFSKANNQAMRLAKGEFVLLLNPDTIVEEETFEKTVQFMDEHPDAGGLGVKMLDGKGNFLPESKRGLPTPSVAFYKIFGLARIFPRSKKFGRYHLGFLDKDETHEVEILSGAFMLMRKTALDKVGLLDEDFFMYGEDIDLSYRLILGGYKNYYYPGTRIIHYKGESTKKSSVNYVFVFYNAMIIFARKHFSQKNARLFSFLINTAVYLRAGAAIVMRLIKRMALPLLDASMIIGSLYALRWYFEHYVKTEGYYSPTLVNIAFPAYTLIWLSCVYFSGGYDKPVRLLRIFRGVVAGTAFILIVYALLPETYRFSRLITLIGSGTAIFSLFASRSILHIAGIKSYRLDGGQSKRIAIVGSEDECMRVNALLRQTSITPGFVAFIDPGRQEIHRENYLGHFGQLKEIATIYQINEIIFCARDLNAQSIIDQMSLLDTVDFKIAPPESLSIIGSNSIDTAGDLYVIDINSVAKPVNKRNKRVMDVSLSLLFLPLFPLLMLLMKNPAGFVSNLFLVLFGKKSWVGYSASGSQSKVLPAIRKGVVCPSDALPDSQRNDIIAGRLDMTYAKDYKIENDLNIIRKAFRLLGKQN